ncbi:hypothetical protein R2R35_15305 [Anaerocolumna sp. AGMB13020]|uniref:hypothetical protein n=1 Tax=Anaerocolumna sp. AGMB13020 TaxID=3081750 RepID=UPI002955A16A|nr:hypothetical protein [Anaerocolumna sp. AGMB13020]WOO35162.1 hypothetical protein R2R35_15305 [Anaerocolumna sp. AGMB13020]
MKSLKNRLNYMTKSINNNKIVIMILGLGSVGTYLLDYLLSTENERFEIVVLGRNKEKIESDINIVRISSLIRNKNRSTVIVEGNIDFECIEKLEMCIRKYNPNFIINSSRVYAGLKYGSISWNKLRAYGIWTPLAIKYIKNIMEACEKADTNAIVINTSYSDAVIPWLKSAEKPYPDFGSGNLNHLIPRIKYAVADMLNIDDYWEIKVVLATGHFHDVVISKEGHNEKVEQLLKIYYDGNELNIDQNEILKRCKIVMPTDSKRNMMNASSNYDIIMSIINAVRYKKIINFFSPGVFGEIGGYPVTVDGQEECNIYINTLTFTIDDMRVANKKSMELDGIEDINNGNLVYTDILLDKVKNNFGVELPKVVNYKEIDTVAQLIIDKIIIPNMRMR